MKFLGKPRRTGAALGFLTAAGLVGALGLAAASDSAERERVPLTPREKAIQALNRLGFGPRPGDVDSVLATGVSAWIERQLDPDRIPDPIVQTKLEDFPVLSMTTAQLFDKFERPVREALRDRKKDTPAASGQGAAEAIDFEKMQEKIPPDQRPRRILEELSAARVVRAAYSQRQLNEVMVDFWMNHFNVFANKGLDRIFMTAFERDTIRPHIWGRFEDLLMATAKSPAMLFYLDNALSTADEAHRPIGPSVAARRRALGAEMPAAAAAGAKKSGGLNENYAREIMELHTLGVDGGYSQKDVTELARVLTGWSIERGGQAGAFLFRDRIHDVGSKTVLGQQIPAGGGIEEGERMIRLLARHPATARHIAFELCQRLVADDPPKELVERVAKKFLATDGDIKQTVRAIVESPEFFDPKSYRAKVKAPFAYVVSAVRAAGGETDGGLPIVRAIAQMGEPLYLCQPPTGYSATAAAWVNTGALVTRLNFALALSAGKIPGTTIDWNRLVRPEESADPVKTVEALGRALTGGDLTVSTRETIEKRLETHAAPADDPSANTQLPLVAGLILGSPEFQRN